MPAGRPPKCKTPEDMQKAQLLVDTILLDHFRKAGTGFMFKGVEGPGGLKELFKDDGKTD